MQPSGPDPEQELGIKDPIEVAGEAETQSRLAKKKTTRKRAKKSEGTLELEEVNERVRVLESLLASQGVKLHDCHMCHKGGATVQRGNTAQWFHAVCLSNFRAGEDPAEKPKEAPSE